MKRFERFREIEGLRACLAWWVVLSHLLGSSGFPIQALSWPLNVLRNGGLAVSGFMIVSGFVITHLIERRAELYGLYIRRRFFRLYPVFMVMCGLSIICWSVTGIASSDADPHRWPLFLVLNATMLHGLIPDELLRSGSRALIGPGWSISLEWQFYLVAPLVIDAVRRRRGWSQAVVALFTAAAIAFSLFNRQSLPYSYPHASVLLFGAHYFLIGILSYHLYVAMSAATYEISSWMAVLGGTLCFAISRNYPASVWLAFFLLLLPSDDPCALKRALGGTVLTWLGKVSYSTYLSHYLLVALVATGLRRAGLEVGTIQFFGWNLLIACALTVPISALLYRYVEMPGIRLGASIGGTTRPGP